MWRKVLTARITIIAVIALLYGCVLLVNLDESRRRSLKIQEEPKTGDCVLATIIIVSVNYSTAEVAARINVQPAGRFAKDAVTPAVNLKLLLNSNKGAQDFDFPKGKRIVPIEVSFALDGNVNAYPFDRHKASLWLLVTTPGRIESSPAPVARNAKRKRKSTKNEGMKIPHAGELVVSPTVLLRNDPVHVAANLSASIPGIQFKGDVARDQGQELTGIVLTLTRPRNVIVLSMIVMGMMAALAMSVLAIALTSIKSEGEISLVPITLAVSLIFGLPALRNVQPGVPPVGAFGDYISFIWAEVIVAASAIIMSWTWLLRQRANK